MKNANIKLNLITVYNRKTPNIENSACKVHTFTYSHDIRARKACELCPFSQRINQSIPNVTINFPPEVKTVGSIIFGHR